MNRLNSLVVVGALSLLSLAGCSKPTPQATVPDAPAAVSPTPDAMASAPATSAAPTGEFGGLVTVITDTKAAVEAGDFSKAKDAFEKFEGHWSKVEDGVKAKSSTTYDAIETAMDGVSNGIKASNKDQTLTALNDLAQNVTSAAK